MRSLGKSLCAVKRGQPSRPSLEIRTLNYENFTEREQARMTDEWLLCYCHSLPEVRTQLVFYHSRRPLLMISPQRLMGPAELQSSLRKIIAQGTNDTIEML